MGRMLRGRDNGMGIQGNTRTQRGAAKARLTSVRKAESLVSAESRMHVVCAKSKTAKIVWNLIMEN